MFAPVQEPITVSMISMDKESQKKTYNGSPRRDVNLQVILPIIPRERGCEEPRFLFNPAQPS